MVQQTQIDRYSYFARKKIKGVLKGLRPSAIKGRFFGPRVLLNSIPKAGTNLLERTLDLFPILRNTGDRTLRGWNVIDDATLEKIRGIKRGQFFNAHLPAHKVLVDLVESEVIKLLMMIRDPRDIVVSYYKYVTEIDLTHNAHKYFFSLPDDDSRLMAAIQGVDGIVSPIFETLSKFEGWLTLDNVLVVRFEHLIGQSGGGDGATQGHIVESLAKYLDIELNDNQTQEIKENIYSTKTLTFRSGKSGNWRKHFGPHHVEAFKENTGDMLVKYGYEENSNW